jgi:AraC-like DNA-binding protein
VAQNEQMDRNLQENIITGQNHQFVHRMLLDFDNNQIEKGNLRLLEGEKCCVLYLLNTADTGSQLSENNLEQIFTIFLMRLICKLYTNHNEIALIVASKELNTDDQLREPAKRIAQSTQSQQALSIGISKPFTEAGFLSNAYHQALDALGMHIVRGSGSICCFREIRNCSTPNYPYRIENAILRASKTLDVNLVREELRKFEQYLIAQDALARVVRDFYVQLFCSYQHLVMELPINHEGMFDLSHMKILGMDSISEMSEYMMDAFAILINAQVQKGAKSELISRICGYIEMHLKDAPIVDAIAAEFFISPSTLRLEFQREMGLSVKNYMDCLRIEQAKKLLVDTNKKIQDIATDLGFNYAQTFIAFFKSSTGMTPGEYRAKEQNQKIKMLSGSYDMSPESMPGNEVESGSENKSL